MYLWTVKFLLNLGSHPESGIINIRPNVTRRYHHHHVYFRQQGPHDR